MSKEDIVSNPSEAVPAETFAQKAARTWLAELDAARDWVAKHDGERVSAVFGTAPIFTGLSGELRATWRESTVVLEISVVPGFAVMTCLVDPATDVIRVEDVRGGTALSIGDADDNLRVHLVDGPSASAVPANELTQVEQGGEMAWLEADLADDALEVLATLARERGLSRLADLGDLPPYGTAEWDEWLQQNPPLGEAS